MRLSTNQIYDNASLSIQRNQSSLYKLQNQLSTGQRVLSPEDDPIAAAQALVVTQASDVNAQQVVNQGNASSQLRIVDSQLSSLVDLMQNVRQSVVQAGSTGTLTNSDRLTIATELESRLSEMMGIANAQNGSGDYLFSGYQGATIPFAINGAGNVVYSGDDGERLLQVSASQQMAVNVAGSNVFMNTKSGNGTFATTAGGANVGSATIDAGSVLDPQQWQSTLNGFAWTVPTNPVLQIKFASATTYQLFDVSNPALPAAIGGVESYVPGQSVRLGTPQPPAVATTDFGGQVVVNGQPQTGDEFTIKPSSNQSLFQTMQSLIEALRTPVSAAYTSTQLSNVLSSQLTNLDQAFINVGNVQATVGTRMQSLDSLGNTASSLKIQYQTTLSGLVDLDYAQAISDFTMQKTYLEAAQQSFAKVTGLSLFNYL